VFLKTNAVFEEGDILKDKYGGLLGNFPVELLGTL
jgi:hypothetical protein